MMQRTMEKQRRGEGGFTLIELLVVIVILGILAAIVVFAIGGLSDSAEDHVVHGRPEDPRDGRGRVLRGPGRDR